MVHWTIYPVIGTVIALFAWFSYYYLRWTRAMDRLNADHFEYLKSPGRISYFTATFTSAEIFETHRRFPAKEEASRVSSLE